MGKEEIHGRQPVDPSIYREVLRGYKGCGKTLGELTVQARQVESDLNARYSKLDTRRAC